MKQSFTYSGESKRRKDAIKKAKKEGYKNFSELIEALLEFYNNQPQWKSVSTGKPVKSVPLTTFIRDGY